jgi:hypothetical protein
MEKHDLHFVNLCIIINILYLKMLHFLILCFIMLMNLCFILLEFVNHLLALCNFLCIRLILVAGSLKLEFPC